MGDRFFTESTESAMEAVVDGLDEIILGATQLRVMYTAKNFSGGRVCTKLEEMIRTLTKEPYIVEYAMPSDRFHITRAGSKGRNRIAMKGDARKVDAVLEGHLVDTSEGFPQFKPDPAVAIRASIRKKYPLLDDEQVELLHEMRVS